MKLLDRVRDFFSTETVAENRALREQVERLRNERNVLRETTANLERQIDDLENDMKLALNAAQKQKAEFDREVEKFRNLAAVALVERDQAKRDLTRSQEARLELATALEEANNIIATLKGNAADRALDAQLDLVHPPASAEELPEPLGDELVQDTTGEFVYQIRGIFFEGRHQWQLQRGEERINAPIHDKDFLEQMAKREVFFGAGDALRAEMRVMTFRPAGGGDLYAKHSVEKVHGIVPPAKQMSLSNKKEAAHAAH